MAAQTQNVTQGHQRAAQNGSKGATPAGFYDKLNGATSPMLEKVQNAGTRVTSKGQQLLDRVFPPEKRSAFFERLQAFVLANPKLSTFLAINLVLTGIPLTLFALFSITVFISSLVTALVLGLLAATVFTVFAVGTALLIVLPTVFFTTCAACFFSFWGLIGYYVLRWAIGDRAAEQAGERSAVGDSLNRITGGRFDDFIENTRSQNVKSQIQAYNDRSIKTDLEVETAVNGSAGVSPEKPQTPRPSAERQNSRGMPDFSNITVGAGTPPPAPHALQTAA